ncbi:hypothetical protein [Hamadaea tsunoensis]|uniref:hypothetical protein n=1 Tax=Hamadaea tsunoensis TaxID=53368 RepID=UPI0007E8B777|nr:hypothetical protein [Hamadaea tsunoensis]
MIRLTKNQALVLSLWLERVEGNEVFKRLVDDRAVWSALLRIEGTLDKSLAEPFHPDYVALLEAARDQLLEELGDFGLPEETHVEAVHEDCALILDKIEFLLVVNRIAVGVDQVEPLLDDLLNRIHHRPHCWPVVSQRLEALLEAIDYNNVVIIGYCMHELRWEQIRSKTVELKAAAGPDQVLLYHRVLESFQDDWPERDLYERFE